MDSGSWDTRLDEFSGAYGRVVGLLDAVVCRRLASEMASRLRGRETITIGPVGARVELTAEGFRLKKPFSKVVAWSSVAGTEFEGGGRVYFLVPKGGRDEPTRHSMVPLDGENIVVSRTSPASCPPPPADHGTGIATGPTPTRSVASSG